MPGRPTSAFLFFALSWHLQTKPGLKQRCSAVHHRRALRGQTVNPTPSLLGGGGAAHARSALYACVHIQSPWGGVIFVCCATSHLDHTHTPAKRSGFGCASSLLYHLRPGPAGPGPKVLTLSIFNDLAGVFFHATVRPLWPILLSHPSVLGAVNSEI